MSPKPRRELPGVKIGVRVPAPPLEGPAGAPEAGAAPAPAPSYGTGSGAPWVLAFDVGGTDLKAAAIGRAGEVLRFECAPSRVRESEGAPFEVMRELAERLGAGRGAPRASGVGIPGVVNPLTGSTVGRTPNLPHWDSFPLRARLDAALKVPIAADNDANLAAFAEHRIGAARGTRVSLTVTVGTGVGCGVVADGKIFRGSLGGAGEIGHLPLGSGALKCDCEVTNCVEPEMSGSGLVRAARAAGLNVENAEQVYRFAALGELRAKPLIARLPDRLGAAIAVAINLFNPDIVVVGGGVSQAGDALFVPLRQAVQRYALASHCRGLRILPAALGGRAGVVGAGLLAWEMLERGL